MGTFSRAPRRSHVLRALRLGAGEIGLVRPARALPAALCASAMSCGRTTTPNLVRTDARDLQPKHAGLVKSLPIRPSHRGYRQS